MRQKYLQYRLVWRTWCPKCKSLAQRAAKRKEPGPVGCSKQRVNERTSLTHRAAKTKEPDPAGRLKVKSLTLRQSRIKPENDAKAVY